MVKTVEALFTVLQNYYRYALSFVLSMHQARGSQIFRNIHSLAQYFVLLLNQRSELRVETSMYV